jgi:protein-disulfide isomerase
MMEGSERSNKGLIASIVFASLVISGSMVYLGMQMSGTSAVLGDTTDAEIERLIQELKAGNPEAQAPAAITASKEELFDDDAFLGNKNAQVALIEFSDYQCPFCNRHFTQTFPQIKKEYVDTGKIAYVYRDLPLSFHYDALPAAIAAECVREQNGDEAYFQMHAKIFGGVAATGTIPKEILSKYATDLGVNMNTFESCMNSPERESEVQADIAAASRYGINGTPGFLVTDGETTKFISGAQSFAVFQTEIDALLQ